MGAGTLFELGIKSDFRETGVFRLCDVASPTILSCHQQGLDSRQVVVGGVAQWLWRRSLTGGLSLIRA